MTGRFRTFANDVKRQGHDCSVKALAGQNLPEALGVVQLLGFEEDELPVGLAVGIVKDARQVLASGHRAHLQHDQQPVPAFAWISVHWTLPVF